MRFPLRFRTEQIILSSIFLLVLFTRFFIASAHPQYAYDAYEHIRQIEHIRDTGTHIVVDDLSYGGRTFVILPFFHYLLGFLSMFFSLDFVLVFFPNLFASSIVFIAYTILWNWTKNTRAALIGAGIAGFTPMFFSQTLFSVSPLSLFIPLMFLLLSIFTQLQRKQSLLLFIVLSFVLPMISIYSLLIVLTFLLYLLFASVEQFKFKGIARELTIFFSFFSLWFLLLIFKKPLLSQGPRFIMNSVPEAVRQEYFFDISFFQLFGGLGVLSLIVGTYVLYVSLFERNDHRAYLWLSLICATLLCIWLSLMKISTGLSIIALCLSLFAGVYIERFFAHLKYTRFVQYQNLAAIILILLFTLSSPVVAILLSLEVPLAQDAELRVMEWAQLNTPNDATMATPLHWGHLVTSIAQRKNIADENYIFAPDAEERVSDGDTIYYFLARASTNSQIISRMHRNGAEYLYLPFGVDDRILKDDSQCFDLVYNKEIKVYKRLCRPVQKIKIS